MRVFSELNAPIVGFLFGSGLATFVHCRLTLRGWGAFRRVPVTWALSAAILYVTTRDGRTDLLIPIVVLTFFAPTLIAEKAIRYRWVKAKVDPRYSAGLCCALFLAAAGIYAVLSYDFMPTNEHVPRQFRNLQTTFWWILLLFLPPLISFMPSRYFLGYTLIGVAYAASGFLVHGTYFSVIGFVLGIAVLGSPFGVLGATLEFLPIPEPQPKANAKRKTD
jgi:hypothetical protein